MREREEQVNFRVTRGERALVQRLVKRRKRGTGDGSASSWFRDLLYREARDAGLLKSEVTAPPSVATTRERLMG